MLFFLAHPIKNALDFSILLDSQYFSFCVNISIFKHAEEGIGIINLFGSVGNFISTFVLILTLLVLIFYTVATFGLRKAATEQLELSLRPFIIIDVEEDAAMLTRTLIYKNIVHGPAIDIQIVPFDAEEYILNFETHGLMEVGETKKNEYKTPRKESAV